MTAAEQRHQAQQQLNALLKKSDYLNSIINSHRMATAQAIAILIKALVKHDPSIRTAIGEALNEIGGKAWISASVDGDRSLLARSLRAELQRSSVDRPQPLQ